MATRAQLASRGYQLEAPSKGFARGKIVAPDGKEYSYRKGLEKAGFASPEQLRVINDPRNAGLMDKILSQNKMTSEEFKGDRHKAQLLYNLKQPWAKTPEERIQQWQVRKHAKEELDIEERLMPDDYRQLLSPRAQNEA